MTRSRSLFAWAVLAALALAVQLPADESPTGRVIVPLAANYDLDSAAYIYVRTVGESGLVLGQPIARNVRVKTTGSSTSITASTAGTSPFALNTAPPTGGGGDLLLFDLKGQSDAAVPANIIGNRRVWRAILTRADADNVTVANAIDLTAGATFFTRLFQSGTTSADGWVPVSGFRIGEFAWQIQQSDATSIDVKVECETISSADSPFSAQNQVYTKNVVAPYACPSAAGSGACDTFIFQSNLFDRCRLGFKINTDASDAGANLESISAQFVGSR